MMIYRIENDGFRYQELDLEMGDLIDSFPDNLSTLEIHDFSQHNMALSPYWKPVSTGFSSIEGSENQLPDITYWIGATLVLSPKAYRYLGELLSPYGEFLPVMIGGEAYQIFNCLGIVGEGMPLAEIKDKAVFKASWESTQKIFCSEQLKEAIHTFDLAGSVFEEV